MTEATVSKELDYKIKGYAHPSYTMTKLLPQSGQQTVPITAGGGADTTFEIPINASNLFKSELRFTMTPDAKAAKATWLPIDALTPFRQIQLYTRGGVYLADINAVNTYTNCSWKADTKLQDFLTFDQALRAAGGGTTQFLQRNNSLVTAAAADANTPSAQRFNNTASNINYTEPIYLLSGTAVASATPPVVVRFPLGMLTNTIFSIDKDILFNEIMILRFVWNPTTRIGYRSNAQTDPVTGAEPWDNNISISDLTLYIATEKNDLIKNSLSEKINSEAGFNILIPYIFSYQNNLTGASQSISLRFNRGHGRRLLKIYHSSYNNADTVNTMYDHSNIADAKVLSFYTMMDNKRSQEFDLDTSNFEDYMLLQDYLKGSVIQNTNIYQFNWVWIEDFTGVMKGEDGSNLETGLDLNAEKKWDIYLTTAGNPLNNFTFAVTQKMLTISKAGISCI